MATFIDKIHNFCDWAWASPGRDAVDFFGHTPWYGTIIGIAIVGLFIFLAVKFLVVSVVMMRTAYLNLGHNPTVATKYGASGIFLFMVCWLATTFFLNIMLIGLFGVAWKGIYFIHYATP